MAQRAADGRRAEIHARMNFLPFSLRNVARTCASRRKVFDARKGTKEGNCKFVYVSRLNLNRDLYSAKSAGEQLNGLGMSFWSRSSWSGLTSSVRSTSRSHITKPRPRFNSTSPASSPLRNTPPPLRKPTHRTRNLGIVVGAGTAAYFVDREFNSSALSRTARTAWYGYVVALASRNLGHSTFLPIEFVISGNEHRLSSELRADSSCTQNIDGRRFQAEFQPGELGLDRQASRASRLEIAPHLRHEWCVLTLPRLIARLMV